MSAVVRARYRTKCARCPDPIYPNDNIVFIDDRPVHAEHEEIIDFYQLVCRAFDDWRSIAFEHGELFHNLPLDGSEAAVLAEQMGRGISEAMREDPDAIQTANIGTGFMVGIALSRYMYERGVIR
jgi:hypothetical protein